MTWMKNVRNYVEETETYILNDEHAPPEVVDDGWALVVERDLCFDPHLQAQFFLDKGFGGVEDGRRRDYAEGVGRFAAYDSDTDSEGRPFPGPFWDVKALKNPLPSPRKILSKGLSQPVL